MKEDVIIKGYILCFVLVTQLYLLSIPFPALHQQ